MGDCLRLNLNGFSGYLSDVGDVNQMTKNAIRILEDSDNLIKFKKNAKIQANKFDVHNIVPSYERYIQNDFGDEITIKYFYYEKKRFFKNFS